MGIEDLKRWQWVAAGIVLGLILALWLLFLHRTFGPRYDSRVDRSLDQRMFERSLLAPNYYGEYIHGSVTVHPPESDGKMWVTGYLARPQRAQETERRAYLFMSGTDVPYKPLYPARNPTPAEPYTVVHYLDDIRKDYPDAQIEFTHAWWEQALPSTVLTVGLIAFIVGGLLPTALWAMSGAGYGMTDKQRAERDARRAAKAAAKAARNAPSAHPSDEPRLLAAARAAEAIAQRTPVADPLPQIPQHPSAPKHYQGEFYPVEKPVGKSDKHD